MTPEILSFNFFYILLVFIGGGLGAALRHITHQSLSFYSSSPGYLFTLFINLIGCFVAGFVFSYLDHSPKAKIFIITGILGGFTTYSLFSLDALDLYFQSTYTTLIIYIASTSFGSFLAALFGFKLFKVLSSNLS